MALSNKLKQYFSKIIQEADAKRKYKMALKIFKKRQNKIKNDPEFKILLAFLYDHCALLELQQSKVSRDKLLYKQFLNKALNIYRSVLKKDRFNISALKGLKRLYEASGKYEQALKYGKKAFNLIQKYHQKKDLIVLGNTYYLKGDYKNAEKWFKKEIQVYGKNIATLYNIVSFYNDIGQYGKSLYYTLLLEKKLKGAKDLFPKKFSTIKTNKTLKMIFDAIQKVKYKSRMDLK